MEPNFIGEINRMIKNHQSILLTGLADSARNLVWAELYRDYPGTVLCLVADEEKAYDLAREMAGFIDKDRIYLFIGRSFLFMREAVSPSEVDRIKTLEKCLMHPGKKAFIIATAASFIHPLAAVEEMKNNLIYLRLGEEIDFDRMGYRLTMGGYSRADTVTRPGEYAIRGDIIDVFPLQENQPYRIELFGDTVESIRCFDSNTQRSGKKAEVVTVFPADELGGRQLTATLLDYLGNDSLILFDEPRNFYQIFDRAARRYKNSVKEARETDKKLRELPLVERERISASINRQRVLFHAFFPCNIPQVEVAAIKHISQKEMEPFFGDHNTLFNRIREWQGKGFLVMLAVKNRIAREKMQRELRDNYLSGIDFVNYQLEKGFVSPTMQIALVSEKDIWGKRNISPKRQTHKSKEERLLAEDLKMGDYVVRESYGVGIYRGVTQVQVEGITREYILLQYAGTDKLYLPPEKLDL